jgi:hypothetical protein
MPILEPIVERQHRPRVDDFLQLADGRRADALGRRIGSHRVGMLFFGRLQLAQRSYSASETSGSSSTW